MMASVELLAALVLTIFAHMTYHEQLYSDTMTDDFVINWQSKPIVDIIATDDLACPTSYVPLVQDKWLGTGDGCYCPNDNKLEAGKCDDLLDTIVDFFQDNDDCQDVKPVEAQGLPILFGKNICVMRQGDAFTQAVRPYTRSGQQPCPQFYRLCGQGQNDDNLCVNQEFECPINDIQIIMPDERDLPGYHTIELSNGIKLAFTRDASKPAITELRVTESEVCMNKDEFGISGNREPYQLYENTQCDYSIAGKHTDPRYEVIGKIREDFLFYENGINTYLEQLPGYNLEQGKKFAWDISQSRYFKWSLECEQRYNIGTKEIVKDLKYSMNAVQAHDKLYFYATIYWLLCALLVGFHLYSLVLTKCCNFNFCFSVVNFLEVLNYIARLVFLILLFISFSQINTLYGENYAKSTKIEVTADCSDYVGNMVLKDFVEGLNSSVLKHTFGGYMVYVCLGIWGLLFLLLVFRRVKHL